ncbi:MAG: ROK family protein [bacterium]|nr:ROK family protein [bacterium]
MSDPKDILTSQPTPSLMEEQIKKFTMESLRGKSVASFDLKKAAQALDDNEGQRVKAIDMGGDKISAVTLQVADGRLRPNATTLETVSTNQGEGYLKFLESLATETSSLKLPLGISSAGPLEGTKPLAWHKVPVFMEELQARYQGDLGKLFPSAVIFNDAVAGLMAGAVEAQSKFPGTEEVLYLINGSGVGGAVLKEGTIYATEPGHIPLVEDLNPYHQDKACGVFGAKNVCIELAAGSKAGIEDLWQKTKGEALSGEEIGKKLSQGDELAKGLYLHSAYLLAHVVMGMRGVFNLFEKPGKTVLGCHGGAFRVPGYTQRLVQILEKNLKFDPQVLITSDFSFDLCLEGAAIGALMKKPSETSTA